MDIVRQAFRLVEVVTGFAGRARQLYYAVVLMGHSCPACGGKLAMAAEGLCRCQSCGQEFDPTIAFQHCSVCGGEPVLRVRRYECRQCGTDLASRFLFDSLVFDADYFRQKMAESRERKKQLREQVREMLAASRSGAVSLPEAELSSVPDLADALNSLVIGSPDALPWEPDKGFDLKCYESHIQAHIRDFPICLDDVPPLAGSARKDRVWRFIAIIFLAHFGLVDIWQEGQSIMVMKHETNREGQDISGDPEGADGLEGSPRGIEAW
jgi:hypothetical protein